MATLTREAATAAFRTEYERLPRKQLQAGDDQMPIEFDVRVFEDKEEEGDWRVEYFDEGGGCYIAIFAGPGAEQRARDYGDALTGGTLKAACAGRTVRGQG